MTTTDDLFARLTGAILPGGCDTCAAEQRLSLVTDGVWMLRVYHDDSCPVLRAMRGARPTGTSSAPRKRPA